MIPAHRRTSPILVNAVMGFVALLLVAAGAQAQSEVRGTWLTTTANDHISSPANTRETMQKLRSIGLNTVYVEVWKNGYTQFPSVTLRRLIGVDRRPELAKQDPADPDGTFPARDLLGETLDEAHRNGLIYIAWFEYGFMAAHQGTMNQLREVKPDWLSRNLAGETVAPNGFVWLNPLHPQARRFLLDIVLEAIDRYDLDGVQLDDRIVWPHVTMGYDDFTRAVYANEHGGAQPPENDADPEWIAWRSRKIDEYAKQFVAEVRSARPGIVVSVSPAPFPWVYDNYCLDWIQWAADGLWDEYIPQCYRYDYPGFRATWDQQVEQLQSRGAAGAVEQMLAGVLTTGSRPEAVPWDDLRQSVEHVRQTGGGGHVWWFSRGVIDEYPEQIARFYADSPTPHAPHPRFGPDWRPAPIALDRTELVGGQARFDVSSLKVGRYRILQYDLDRMSTPVETSDWTRSASTDELILDPEIDRIEILVDRRTDFITLKSKESSR